MDPDAGLSTSEYVRHHRLAAHLSVEELASRVGVSANWLTRFEAGDAEELTYTSDPAAWPMLLNKSIGTDTGRVSQRFATATGYLVAYADSG